MHNSCPAVVSFISRLPMHGNIIQYFPVIRLINNTRLKSFPFTWNHWLRRSEAPHAMPHRAKTATARYGQLSLSTESQRPYDFGKDLHGPFKRMTDRPQVLLNHHLKKLKLPTFLKEYSKVARQCSTDNADYERFLLQLSELELIDRQRRMTERKG